MKLKLLLLALSFPVLAKAQPLFLDHTFGNNGGATSQTTGWEKEAYNMIRQQDGKLLVAGVEYETNGQFLYQSLITRFLPDGPVDNSFGTNGSVRIATGNKNSASAICLQPDGKILVAGNESIIREQGNPPSAELLSRPYIARLHANGTPDQSFGNNGILHPDLLDLHFTDKELTAIDVLPDGKIIAGGTGLAGQNAKMILLRLHADGTYDNSFGMSGLHQYTIEAGQDAVMWDMALQSDNKLILAGSTGSASLPTMDDRSFALARINADGTPDLTFGVQGMVVTRVSGTGSLDIVDVAHRVLLQPDGKICLAGAAGNALGLARYNADGTPDASFGQNGKIVHPLHPAATGLARLGNKLYTCGMMSVVAYTLDIALSAFNADGSADNTFAPGGILTTHIYHSNYTHALLAQPDGRLVTAGAFQDEDGDGGLLLTRFSPTTTTGITPVKDRQAVMTLFPNPAKDRLTLTISHTPATPEGELSIIGVAGQMLYTSAFQGNNVHIPISQLAAGVYALRINTGTEMQTLRFVKK